MKLYNTIQDISSNLTNFFQYINLPISKPHLKFLPDILIALINAESIVTSDISKHINYLNINDDSIQRKIRRLLNSSNFYPYLIYDAIIKHVIINFKSKHSDNRIHISLDHMFCSDRFTTLSFNLRLGKQSIPLWFRSFKGKTDPDAFDSKLIIEGINYIANLFHDKNYDIIFLADRWFPNCKVLDHINKLGHTYVFRTRAEHKIKFYDSHEKHDIWKYLKDFKPRKFHSIILKDITYTFRRKLKTNIVIGKLNPDKDGNDDHWIIVTNKNPERAIKDYSYRFGAIECNFKNTKTNGFYLETTKIKNIHAFRSMYTIINIAILWLTILGIDYSKNKHRQYKKISITDVKKYKNKYKRVLSLFNTGLTLFKKCFNSLFYITLKCNFILHDY